MRVEIIDNGFISIIENGIIEKVICKYDEPTVVYFHSKPPQKINIVISPYNRQFGTPVSDDGRMIFVSSWEKGLFTYDIMSGALIWHYKDSKISSIVVQSTYIVIQKYGASIIKLDIDNGSVLSEIKSSTIEYLYRLSGPYVLINSIKGKLSVIDTEKMLVIKKYNPKIINPQDCLSLLIQDALLEDNKLTICGVEDYTNKNHNASSPQKFSRVIDTNFYAF